MIEPEYKEYIQDSVCKDGIDFTFRFDDEVKDFEDKKFQKLRQAYADAVRALLAYCQIDDEE